MTDRSWLRQRDIWRKACRLQDAHVRAYLESVTPTGRQFWQCVCGSEIQNRMRPRDSSGSLKKHCGCRNFRPADPVPIHMRPANRERRIKSRRLQRQQIAAAQGREIKVWRYFDAHVKAWKAFNRQLRRLHDQHVKRYKEMANDRLKWHSLKGRETTRSKRLARRSRHRDELSDWYIVSLLTGSRNMAPVVKQLPQQLIELKREQMRLLRMCKTMKDGSHENGK